MEEEVGEGVAQASARSGFAVREPLAPAAQVWTCRKIERCFPSQVVKVASIMIFNDTIKISFSINTSIAIEARPSIRLTEHH